jgi:hypothetical protein
MLQQEPLTSPSSHFPGQPTPPEIGDALTPGRSHPLPDRSSGVNIANAASLDIFAIGLECSSEAS